MKKTSAKASTRKSKAKKKSKPNSWLLTIAGTVGVLLLVAIIWTIYKDAISVSKTSNPMAYTCPRTLGHHEPLSQGSSDKKSNNYCVHLAQELYNFQANIVRAEGPTAPDAIPINGTYDAKTTAAIKKYQSEHSPLKATGKVDFYTWNALEGASAPYDKTPTTMHLVAVKDTTAKCGYGQVTVGNRCQVVLLAWRPSEKAGDGVALSDGITLLHPGQVSTDTSASWPRFWQAAIDSYTGFVTK